MQYDIFLVIIFIIAAMSVFFITILSFIDVISSNIVYNGLLAGVLVIFLAILCFTDIKLEKSVPVESKTEIQEIISQKTSSRSTNITYKDLSDNTKKIIIEKIKTSEEDIPYTYIETKTYKWGFLYKDVNTLYLKR